MSAVAEDDASLIARIARGDLRALELAYRRYGRSVYSLAMRMLDDAPAAEGVVQTTFTLLWRQASKIDAGSQRLLPWLLCLTHAEAVQQLRSRGERAVGPERRMALDLAYYAGLKDNEIASVLGQSQIAVRTEIRSGLQRLLASTS